MVGTSKRASDFVSKPFDCDDVRDVESILDTDFELKEAQFRQGQFGEYLSMLCVDLKDVKPFVINCGGGVVIKKMKEILSKTKPPLLMKLIKTKTYYDIS